MKFNNTETLAFQNWSNLNFDNFARIYKIFGYFFGAFSTTDYTNIFTNLLLFFTQWTLMDSSFQNVPSSQANFCSLKFNFGWILIYVPTSRESVFHANTSE